MLSDVSLKFLAMSALVICRQLCFSAIGSSMYCRRKYAPRIRIRTRAQSGRGTVMRRNQPLLHTIHSATTADAMSAMAGSGSMSRAAVTRDAGGGDVHNAH